MRPIFANTANISALERLIFRYGRLRRTALKVRSGLIIHPKMGPVLIDAGYGQRVTEGPDRSWGLRFYAWLLRPRLNADQSPQALLGRHGFRPEDVRLVVVTHFHADHVSCLRDFPNARFLVDGSAWQNVQQASYLRNLRDVIFSELFPDDFADRVDDINQLARVEILDGLALGIDLLQDGSALGLPLPGHADGHFGIYFPNPERPVLYAADTQWLIQAVAENRSPKMWSRMVSDDWQAARDSTDTVRRFMEAGVEVLLCHDPDDTAFDMKSESETG